MSSIYHNLVKLTPILQGHLHKPLKSSQFRHSKSEKMILRLISDQPAGN